MPLADRELDQLVTQLSNDNVPLIDFGLMSPGGAYDSPLMSELRRHGMTLVSAFPHQATDIPPPSLLLFYDGEVAPDVAKLKAAKAAGIQMAFMSRPGTTAFDEAQFKRRIKLISEAGLNGKDFWIPGK